MREIIHVRCVVQCPVQVRPVYVGCGYYFCSVVETLCIMLWYLIPAIGKCYLNFMWGNQGSGLLTPPNYRARKRQSSRAGIPTHTLAIIRRHCDTPREGLCRGLRLTSFLVFCSHLPWPFSGVLSSCYSFFLKSSLISKVQSFLGLPALLCTMHGI